MLTPLKQFVCDECGKIIDSPKEGYVEWEYGTDENGKMFARGFRIVHAAYTSPLKDKNKEGCYKYGNSLYRSDIDLEYFLKHAHQYMYSYLHLGFLHDPKNEIGCQIDNFPEFVDFFKRLTIPYYEEARLSFGQALADGIIADENEIYLFTEDVLKSIVDKYQLF